MLLLMKLRNFPKPIISFLKYLELIMFTIYLSLCHYMGFLVAQLVKNPPAMWETWVLSLGWGDPMEKGTATHSSILAWRIPWTV